MDFEIGKQAQIPTTRLKRCMFHWTQTLWRQAQEIGLAVAYREQRAIHSFIRQLLALPFLPAAYIGLTFAAMKGRAQLQQLVDYIERQ